MGRQPLRRLSGILSPPALLATALAPWAGSALAAALGGYPALFVLLAGVAGCGALLAIGSVPASLTRRRQRSMGRPVSIDVSHTCAARSSGEIPQLEAEDRSP
jgi:hypothetical protein